MGLFTKKYTPDHILEFINDLPEEERSELKDKFNDLYKAEDEREIDKIEEDEREKTGIKTLKIGYNRVFGYYIEVTKSLISQVPERYIRKQTLSNCERYITEELKSMEATVLGAKDKLCNLEYELFVFLLHQMKLSYYEYHLTHQKL